MDRPAMLSLVDTQGQRHQVVIASLGYDHAKLISNGKLIEIPLAELTYYWYGDHLLLWRPGMPVLKDLAPGMRDRGVLWLRETLARIRGEPLPSETSDLYDAELESRVRQYQRERLLTVDGIVGARTQIAMTTDLDMPPIPRLLASH
jgi:general secretion pathway protein A